MINIAIFASGRGSNFINLFNYFKANFDNVKFKAFFTDNKLCQALRFALDNKIDSYIIVKTDEKKEENEILNDDLKDTLIKNDVDFIFLCGYLKKIPDDVVDAFVNKIINIHPSLLPLFGGKGMYGMRVHEAVFKSGMKVSGATVHFVDKIYDNGLIIAQKCVDISNASSPEEIANKVLEVEHKLYPYAAEKLITNKIKIENNRTIVL